MPIDPLPNEFTWPFTPAATSFESDFNDQIGTMMDENDGFDDILTGVTLLTDPDIAEIENMAFDLADADFAVGEIQQNVLNPLWNIFFSIEADGYYAVNESLWSLKNYLVNFGDDVDSSDWV